MVRKMLLPRPVVVHDVDSAPPAQSAANRKPQRLPAARIPRRRWVMISPDKMHWGYLVDEDAPPERGAPCARSPAMLASGSSFVITLGVNFSRR